MLSNYCELFSNKIKIEDTCRITIVSHALLIYFKLSAKN